MLTQIRARAYVCVYERERARERKRVKEPEGEKERERVGRRGLGENFGMSRHKCAATTTIVYFTSSHENPPVYWMHANFSRVRKESLAANL